MSELIQDELPFEWFTDEELAAILELWSREVGA